MIESHAELRHRHKMLQEEEAGISLLQGPPRRAAEPPTGCKPTVPVGGERSQPSDSTSHSNGQKKGETWGPCRQNRADETPSKNHPTGRARSKA